MIQNRAVRANGQATQERIISSACAMFAATGYEATSLRQIAAAAEIDIATLKYHFKDKATLFGESYRVGHLRFLEVMEPFLQELEKVQSSEAMRVLLDDFVTAMHDFVERDLEFVRMTLFRMLEDSAEIISVEEELQTLAISQIDSKFRKLVARGIVRDVDTRAFVVFLVSSFSTWHVTGRVKEHWLGHPTIASKAGRARSETFFVDLMDRFLL